MREQVQALEDLIRADGGQDQKMVNTMFLEVLATMAIRLEGVQTENARLRDTVETLIKGGKPVMSGGSSGFSIG